MLKKLGQHGGGLGGLAGEFGDLVSSLPSGIAQMAVSGAKEVEHYAPHHLVLGALHGDVNEALQGVPGIGAGFGVAEGLVGGATGDPNAVQDHPLSAMQGGSFRNTYEDVIHPTRFARAYEQGHLLGKLVEDAANVSLVAAPAAKALDIGASGAFAEAEAAGKGATSAEKAAAAAEGAAVKAETAAQGHVAYVERLNAQLDSVAGTGARDQIPALRAEIDRAARQADSAARTAADARAAANAKTTEAFNARNYSEALKTQASGPLYRAYRVAHATAQLGGEGANAPAKPFELAWKGFTKGLRDFVDETPSLRNALGAANERIGMSEALRNTPILKNLPKLSEKIGEGVAKVSGPTQRAARGAVAAVERRGQVGRFIAEAVRPAEARGAKETINVQRAVEAMRRAGADDEVTFQTAELHAMGVGAAIVDQARALGKAVGADERLPRIISEMAARLNLSPQAIVNAIQLAADPRALPELRGQVDTINRIWDARIGPWLEDRITGDTTGLRQEPTPQEMAYNFWNVSQTADLPPGMLDALHSRGSQLTEQLGREYLNQARKVAKKAGKIGVTPGATGPEAARQAAAGAVEGTTGRGALGPLRAVQQASEAAGRASVGRSAAERFRTVRDSIPESVPDEAIAHIVDAADRFQRAAADLHSTTAEAALAGERARPADVIGHVREVRAQAVEVANAELQAITDSLPSEAVPFVPSDLSEYHAQLHGDLAGAELNIRDRFDRLRRQKGMPNDEEAFVRAYRQTFNAAEKSLALKGTIEALDENAVRQMYRQWRDGTFVHGGLDAIAENYLGDRASGDPGVDIPAVLDAYARKAKLEAFTRAARGPRWNVDALDQLRSAVHDPGVLAMLDDPAVAAAFGQGKLTDVAAEVAAVRADQATAGFPSREDAVALMADNFDTTANADLAPQIERMAGGPELLDAWVAAGADQVEGSLDQALIDIGEGKVPEFARPAPDAGALGSLRGQEAARSEIGQVVGEAGGQAARSLIGREAGMLDAGATRAEKVAARGPEAEKAAVEGLTQLGSLKGTKVGKKLAKYEDDVRELHKIERKLAGMPEWYANEVEKLYADLTNAPSHTRSAVSVARDFTGAIADWRKELVDGGATEDLLAPLDEAIRLGIKDVRDIYGEKVAGPGGTLTPAPPRFTTEFRPGGQPMIRNAAKGAPRVREEARPIRAVKGSEEHVRRTAIVPTTTDELKVVLRERITSSVRNRAARMTADLYGVHPDQLLAADALAEMSPQELYANMRAQGYVPWDPQRLVQAASADKLPPGGGMWLPEPIAKAAEKYYGKVGGFERFLRKYYDKPLTFWKAAVLALRPAWHVNNVLSNALMAMVGAGMDPLTYARRMRQAHALLKLNEAELDVALPEGVVRTGPMSARRIARATSPARLEKLRARVNTIEPSTLEALGGAEATPPALLVEGGAGAGMGATDYSLVNKKGETVGKSNADQAAGITATQEVDNIVNNPSRLRRFVNGSYELNGTVDDASRLAVFLEQRKKLTERDLNELIARNPELAKLTPEEVRTEGAIRLSLKIAGDFLRMTPVERQVFRRIFPFYVWMRHITGLTAHLVAFHPLRVVWGLHLAQMFGTPGEFGLASAYVRNPGSILQLPTISPFGDSTQPSPDQLGFNVSPLIKLPIGILTGLDVNRMAQFQRPPGQPGGYGGPVGQTPLINLNPASGGFGQVRLSELANLLAQQFPQTRAARGFTEQLLEGKPVMRYPLGQVRRTPKTQGRHPIGSGEPVFGPLARYLGLPYEREPNVYERPDVKETLKTRRRRRKTAGRR